MQSFYKYNIARQNIVSLTMKKITPQNSNSIFALNHIILHKHNPAFTARNIHRLHKLLYSTCKTAAQVRQNRILRGTLSRTKEVPISRTTPN